MAIRGWGRETSWEQQMQQGSEGSLTGAYGLTQEGLDVLGDNAEYLHG